MFPSFTHFSVLRFSIKRGSREDKTIVSFRYLNVDTSIRLFSHFISQLPLSSPLSLDTPLIRYNLDRRKSIPIEESNETAV